MGSVDTLKYAIFNEWTDDPPAGCVTLYYASWFESCSEVKPIIDEIIDHVKDAIGYEEPDDEDLEDEDFEDEIEGLDPSDENGDISVEDIKAWDWDNGGSGCGCVVYAEGIDIAEAASDFCEEHMDDIEELDFDEDDDGNIILEFPVTVCIGSGDGGDVLVDVPVSREEFIELLQCYRNDSEISDWNGLVTLVSKIESAASDEAEAAADELGEEIDCSEASCLIAFPDDIPDIADEFAPGLTSIEIEMAVEKARTNPADTEAVMSLLRTVDALIENLNESLW